MAVSSPEDVVNEALNAIGVKRRIADIYEGSPAARAALEVYGQTRDEILRGQDWPFARGAGIALTLLKGPPPAGGYNPIQPWSAIYPAPPWLYEYAYPSDCLDLLAIQGAPASLPVLDPRPVAWRIDNDLAPVVSGQSAAGPPQRVILTNEWGAMGVYRRRVTNPLLWEPLFTATLIEALGSKLALRLTGNIQARQATAKDGVDVAGLADMKKG
jgi:hypothetical protein